MTPSPEVESFEQLYRSTRIDVLNYLLRRTADREDAADLLAEVYVVAWRRRADRPDGDEARLWLFGVARRVLADHCRSQVRRRAAADGLRTLLSASPDPRDSGPTPADPRRESAVHAALTSLSELDRELITLISSDGLSPAQAAAVLGISAGNARVRLHRARSRLRRRAVPEAVEDQVEQALGGCRPIRLG
jgi:RNA polymerase sigma-70 factor (ECF subfamily)